MAPPNDFKSILILATLIAVVALNVSAQIGCEGFQSNGVYTLLGIQLQNANVDSFLKSTTGYASMFASIKDMNGKLIWKSGSSITTGPSLQNFIVYFNPLPPAPLSDIQTNVSNLKININNAYGSPVISQFILSLPNGTFVNENGKPIVNSTNNFGYAIAIFFIVIFVYFVFIRGKL